MMKRLILCMPAGALAAGSAQADSLKQNPTTPARTARPMLTFARVLASRGDRASSRLLAVDLLAGSADHLIKRRNCPPGDQLGAPGGTGPSERLPNGI
jgi:hypothetical protein